MAAGCSAAGSCGCWTGARSPYGYWTRDPERARHLSGTHVAVVVGDVRDREAVARAMDGVQTVISAIQGLSGKGDDNPRTVDWQGNGNLIDAARAASVAHFILVSVQGAAPDHPRELFRMKHRAEQQLRASGLAWTIIRPTASMETWAKIVGEPLATTRTTRVFGRGANPINFVSAADVAQLVAQAVSVPAMRGEVVEVGGPENLSMVEFAQAFASAPGKGGKIRHIPLPMMRAMAVFLRPLKPAIARQIHAGVVMDTREMTFDAAETRRRYPTVAQTSLAEMVRRDASKAV